MYVKTSRGIESMFSYYKEMISLQKDRHFNQCGLFIALHKHALKLWIMPKNLLAK